MRKRSALLTAEWREDSNLVHKHTVVLFHLLLHAFSLINEVSISSKESIDCWLEEDWQCMKEDCLWLLIEAERE